jgi:hypothetical protein
LAGEFNVTPGRLNFFTADCRDFTDSWGVVWGGLWPHKRAQSAQRLCLNALHDRAFDRCLMFFDQGLRVRFRAELKSLERRDGLEWLLSSEGRQIRMPRKFSPDLALIEPQASTCGLSHADFEPPNALS